MIASHMNSAITQHRNLYRTVFFLFSFLLLAFPTAADEINYFYDDAGRLVRAVKDSERVLYRYDEVGNLLSISRENSASQASPPALQGIDPDIFLIGGSYHVIISGQNLLTTSSVTSDDPNITIKNVSAINTKILATISIAGTATPGQANITITTAYGSASMPINLHRALIDPEAMTLFPGSTASFSVSLTPPAARELTAMVINKDPGILEIQSSVFIPPEGSAALPVKAVKEGTGTIRIGSTEATVFVTGSGGLLSAPPVSVSIGSVPDGASINAAPVSVMIGNTCAGSVLSHSRPVSVIIGDIYLGPVVTHSNPVSLIWTVIPGAIAVSEPVCIEIQQ